MKYGQRLKAARKQKNLSQDELSKISGVGQGSISKIERGDQETSVYDVELAEALDVPAIWLRNGTSNPPKWIKTDINDIKNHYTISNNAHDTRTLGAFTKIPVVGMAQLGDNGYWTELEYSTGHGDGYITLPTRDQNAYALKCTGDSMLPRIKHGEYVVIEPNTEVMLGDEVLVKAKDGRVMIKTYLYTRDEKIHLLSINEAHPPQSIGISEIEKMHAVTAIVKKTLWQTD